MQMTAQRRARRVTQLSARASLAGVFALLAALSACRRDNVLMGPASVSVPPPRPVVTIEVPSTLSIQTGGGVQLTVVLRDSDRVVIENRTVVYQSADPTIAIVSSTGFITGVAPGSTVVTATSEGKSGATQ